MLYFFVRSIYLQNNKNNDIQNNSLVYLLLRKIGNCQFWFHFFTSPLNVCHFVIISFRKMSVFLIKTSPKVLFYRRKCYYPLFCVKSWVYIYMIYVPSLILWRIQFSRHGKWFQHTPSPSDFQLLNYFWIYLTLVALV